MIHEAVEAKRLQNLPIVPKFFLIQCDQDDETKKLCEPHVGTNFPMLKLFRDEHAIRFNRPRVAQTIAWWSTHVARPVPVGLRLSAQVDSYKKGGATLFLLKVDEKTEEDKLLFTAFKDIGFNYIEDYHFGIVEPASEAGKALNIPNPGVTVIGEKHEPLPFDGEMNEESLAAWINLNQFQPVTALSPFSSTSLSQSRLPVVCLIYQGTDADRPVLQDFTSKAKELRKGGKYVFAVMNISSYEYNSEYLKQTFQLVSPDVSTYPRVFVFQTSDVYWEDASFGPGDITLQSLEALMVDANRQDRSGTAAWAKSKLKYAYKIGTRSVKGFLFVLSIPLTSMAVLFFCYRALCAPDDDEPEKEKKKLK